MTGSTLEYLRIVSEATACLRQRPDSEESRWRRDESIRWAVRHHPVSEVAAVAGIGAEEILEILEPEGEPLAKLTKLRRRARHFSPALH